MLGTELGGAGRGGQVEGTVIGAMAAASLQGALDAAALQAPWEFGRFIKALLRACVVPAAISGSTVSAEALRLLPSLKVSYVEKCPHQPQGLWKVARDV